MMEGEQLVLELERQVQCAESDAVIAAASQKNRFLGWLHRWRGQSKEAGLKRLLSTLYPKLQQAVTETTAWLEQRARHKEAQLQDAQSKQRLLDEAIEAEQRALDCFDDLVNDCLSLSYDMTKSMRDLRAVMDFNEEVLSNASRSRSSSRAHAAAPASAPAPAPPPTSPHSHTPSSASARKKAALALLPLQAQADDEARPAEPAVWHGYKGAENFQLTPKRTIHYSKSPATTSLVSILTAGEAQAANAASTISAPHLPALPAANANPAPNASTDGPHDGLCSDSPSNISTNSTISTHTSHSTSSRPRSLSSSSYTLAHHPSQLSLSTHGKSPLDALQHYHYTDADFHESRGKFAACYEVSCQALAMVDALRRQRQAEAVALSSAKKQRAALCTLCQGDSLDDGLDDDGLGGLGCITLEGLSIANGLLRAVSVSGKEGRDRDRDNRDSSNSSSNNGKDGKDGTLLRKSSRMYSVLGRFSAGGAVKAMASSCSSLHSMLSDKGSTDSLTDLSGAKRGKNSSSATYSGSSGSSSGSNSSSSISSSSSAAHGRPRTLSKSSSSGSAASRAPHTALPRSTSSGGRSQTERPALSLSLPRPFDDTETKCEGTALPPRGAHKGHSPSPRERSSSAVSVGSTASGPGGCGSGFGALHAADGVAATQQCAGAGGSGSGSAGDDETQECIEALRAMVQEEQAVQARLTRLQGLFRRAYAVGLRVDPALVEAIAKPPGEPASLR